MGFGVLAGGKAACEYPKISLFPPPRGGGQGVGNPGLSYFVKALEGQEGKNIIKQIVLVLSKFEFRYII
jgi:hypothetical protein